MIQHPFDHEKQRVLKDLWSFNVDESECVRRRDMLPLVVSNFEEMLH